VHWFSNLEKQSKALVGFLSLGLSAFNNKKEFCSKLTSLAEFHFKRGIKTYSYGPFGEALFWALRFCLGDEIYDNQAHKAWVILYSMMLRVIIGKTVEFEIKAKKLSKKSGTTELKSPPHIESYSYKRQYHDPVYIKAV
jgi:hemoglobin-like flavoprotein